MYGKTIHADVWNNAATTKSIMPILVLPFIKRTNANSTKLIAIPCRIPFKPNGRNSTQNIDTEYDRYLYSYNLFVL